MATCLKSTWPASTAVLVSLFIASQLLLVDYHYGHLPAVAFAKQQASMPLGSSWPARDLSYLASPSKHFCFGWREFPRASSSFYVAVWFAALDNAIVWVANRDAPASDMASLQLTSDGNLLISNSIWQTDTASMGVSGIQILDSGNVVLLQGNVRSYAWQSFSSPTDTLLPSQSFLVTQSLISRPPAYSTSLRSGIFKFYSPNETAHIDYIIDASTIWKAQEEDASPPNIALPVSAINSSVIAAQFTQSGVFSMYNSSGNAYFQLVPSDYNEGTSPSSNPIFRRLTLDPDGNLRMYGWDYLSGKWIVLSEAVTSLCSTMSLKRVAVCGSYGVCVVAPEPACACPPGFQPADMGDVTQGCRPDNLLLPSCQNANQSNVNAAGSTYIVLKNTDFLDSDILDKRGISLAACKDMCNSKCSCVGVVYDDSGSGTAATCWLKASLLKGYSPQTQQGNRDVFIRILNSTTATVMNPPSQSPTVAWLNSSAFWSQGSVAQSAPVAQTCNPVATSSKHRRTAILAVSLISVGELLCFIFALFLLQKTNMCRHGKEELSAMQQTPACRAFSYAELVEATNDFRDPLGSGAFGAVVKGVLPDGTEIAVKKLQTSAMQLADSQFKAEIATLGRIHHMNLLRLYGYCADGPDHRLLVYEFMANGSLNRFLFEQSEKGAVGGGQHAGDRADENQKLLVSSRPAQCLDWRARYNICLGTARGLAYLHEECLDCIVHCDIKPENILLDKDFCPKVADLGLAYLFGRNETLQVSNVRGTRGYLAPEWVSYLPITAKADVFSYGMVLIEIVSGRRNFHITGSAMDAGKWTFPSWVFQQLQTGHVEEVVDPKIRESGGVVYAEVEKVLRVAFQCLQQEAIARPTMRSIVQTLESSAAVPILPHTSCSFEEQLKIEPGLYHSNFYSSDDRHVQGPHFTIGSSISLLSGR